VAGVAGTGGAASPSVGAPEIACVPAEIIVDGATSTWAATTVSGRVTAPGGIERVTVDGEATTLDASGDFSVTVGSSFGANAFHVVATDSRGVTSERHCPFNAATTYRPEDEATADSVTLALGQTALDDDMGGAGTGPIDSLGDVIDAGMDAARLASIVDAYLKTQRHTPGSGYYIGNGCALVIFCVDVYYQPSVQPVTLASESIDLDLESRGLRVLVDVEDLSLGIQSQGIVGLASSSGVATVRSANARAEYAIGTKDGSLDATLVADTFASMNDGVDVSVDNFLVELAAQIFPGLIDRIFENVFRDVVSVVLNDILHAVTVDAVGVGVTLPKLDGSGDIAIGLTGRFSSANANSTRLLAGLEPLFTFTGSTPHALVSAGVAAQGGVIAPLDRPLGERGVGLSIHGEVVNRFVHQLWRNGYFQTTLDPMALGSLGVDVGALEDLFTNSNLRLAAPLPPVVSVDADGDKLRIGVAGLRVILTVPDDPVPLELEVFMVLNATPSFSDGRITVGNIATVTSSTTIASAPAGYDTSANGSAAQSAEALVKSLLIDVLGQALIAVPTPSIHLPRVVGALELPAPVTLGLDEPALSATTDYLLVDADFTELR
jgi:hypothetical protein